jgi:hypothetical protein
MSSLAFFLLRNCEYSGTHANAVFHVGVTKLILITQPWLQFDKKEGFFPYYTSVSIITVTQVIKSWWHGREGRITLAPKVVDK